MALLVQLLTPNVTWVEKTKGERKGETALVVANNVAGNYFAVRFKSEAKITHDCNPEEFTILPPTGTEARKAQ